MFSLCINSALLSQIYWCYFTSSLYKRTPLKTDWMLWPRPTAMSVLDRFRLSVSWDDQKSGLATSGVIGCVRLNAQMTQTNARRDGSGTERAGKRWKNFSPKSHLTQQPCKQSFWNPWYWLSRVVPMLGYCISSLSTSFTRHNDWALTWEITYLYWRFINRKFEFFYI